MSRKTIIQSLDMLKSDSIVQPLSANTTSISANVLTADYASIDFKWSSSTVVGSLTVEGKNGENAGWKLIDFGAPITITGTSGSHDIVFNSLPFVNLRFTINITSGSGTFAAILTSKSKGA